ncbi:GNAT family N-acetyltransferase [Alicyclobacillus fodiniaquatilis]|uniref:GNAT family N-acetyltransferase n=1 Tax=Alicyclobacillus fodiniaquatilis TaxID=1661150 RepID=A0ABW4JK45_9BACL
MQSIEIQMLPCHANTHAVEMKQIVNIVNRVYAASEGSLWKRRAIRTTVEEVVDLVRAGEMAVARSPRGIVGCVHIRRIDESTGEFGMLAVDNDFQGTGIGRALVRFAEQKCIKEHLRSMQLELLEPQVGSHPAKVILKNWYMRIGYRPVRTESVDSLFPALVELLAVPCKFVILQKELVEAQGVGS